MPGGDDHARPRPGCRPQVAGHPVQPVDGQVGVDAVRPAQVAGVRRHPDPLGHQRQDVAEPPRPREGQPEHRLRHPGRQEAVLEQVVLARGRHVARDARLDEVGAQRCPVRCRHSASSPPRPCAGKTARWVARTARSTGSAGSNPSCQSAPGGCASVGHPLRGRQAVALDDVLPPSLRHVGRRVQRRTGGHRQQVGPGPRHDLRELVAPAAAGDPATRRRARAPGRAARGTTAADRRRSGRGGPAGRARGCRSRAGSRAPAGRNSASSGGTTAWKARSQPASVVPGGSATLTAEPSARRAAHVLGEAGAGEEVAPALVQRHRQHPRLVPERALDAVAVVHVDVDVGDPLARPARAARRSRRPGRCRRRSRWPRRASRGAGRRRR